MIDEGKIEGMEIGNYKFKYRPEKKSDLNVIQEVIKNNVYEKRGIKYENSKKWLDAGAHIGTFSILLASRGLDVISYEPHPGNYKLLKENIKLNKTIIKGRIKVNKKGLGIKNEKIDLHMAPRSTSFHSTKKQFRNGTSLKIEIENVSKVLKENKDIEGVKLDIQGSEMDILEHVSDWNKVNQIVFEWDFGIDNKVSRLLKVLKRLKAMKFNVRPTVSIDKLQTIKEWTWWPSGVLVYCTKEKGNSSSNR
jgi:FkbM family methyltransferase